MKNLSKLTSVIALALMLSGVQVAANDSVEQQSQTANAQASQRLVQEAPSDSGDAANAVGGPSEKSKIKAFEDVITEEAITREGVFTTHHVGEKVYFEIPADQLGREFVWQIKTGGIQTGKGIIGNDSHLNYVYFERIGDNIFLRGRDYSYVYDEEKRESVALDATDLDAILAKLKIATFGDEEKTRAVVDVTQILLGANPGMNGILRTKADPKASTVKSVKAFERNIEARVLGRFTRPPAKPGPGATPELITAEIRHSILALPDDLMKPRYWNHRVGYISSEYTDFNSDKNKVDTKQLIKRWRLEKKDPSAPISDPVKPIVFYVDRSFPEEYVGAVREGIEFWQPAFEQAGFSNAIIAKMAPTLEQDPDWDPEDARFSVVRWIPSDIPNASGPHVADPRTGEIIEADVMMFQNVLKLLEGWYFAQAGATDPRAKMLPLPIEVMSDLLRFVVAHEVGHSIGLHHNFIGHDAYSIEQLRDPEFVAKNGVSSSIMDYARFNYVMQPGDGVSPIDYMPGPYDRHAIEWGYKQFPGDLSPEQERELLYKIADRALTNKALRWDAFTRQSEFDPRIHTEVISNDAVEATRLGHKNLERIMENLVEAASYDTGNTYAEIEEAYKALATQALMINLHVVRQIGGIEYRNELAVGHDDNQAYVTIPIEKQKDALKFVAENIWKLPDFWKNEEVLKRIGYDAYLSAHRGNGRSTVGMLLLASRTDNLFKHQHAGIDVYDPVELYSDVREALFEEVNQRTPEVNAYRRALQDRMVSVLIERMAITKSVQVGGRTIAAPSNDYKALARGTLATLRTDLTEAAQKTPNTITGMHFLNLVSMIDEAFDTD